MGAEEDRGEDLDALARQVRACTQCPLHEQRTQAVPGEGPVDASVLIVGEAPGREEDATGRPFVGSAGAILAKVLASAGLSREDAFITNIVKCRPPGNRAPRPDEVEACRPYLLRQHELVQPKVIVALGSSALRGLLGPGVDLKEARGRDLHLGQTPVVGTYHPAAVLYRRKLEEDLRRDLQRAARMLRASKPRVRSGHPRAGRPFETTISSGAVVANPDGRILLLRRADEDIWCLPKGTVEAGETLEATAVREVLEESGLRVKLLRPLLTIHYKYYWPPRDMNVDKTVAYFLSEPVGGRLRPERGFDEARWVSGAQGLRLLHWKNDRDVVRGALTILADREATGRGRGPPPGARRSRRRPA